MTKFHIRAAGLALAMTFTGFAGAALAAPRDTGEQAQTISVQVSDIDLTTDQGRTQLHRRLASAAREACASELENPDYLQAQGDFARCRGKAMTAATTKAMAMIASRTTENHLAVH